MFYKIAVSLLVLVLVYFAGFGTHYYCFREEPVVKWKTKIQTDIVYRNYPTVSLPQCIDKLKCYDTSEPRLEMEQLDVGTYRIGAGLCDRSWSRDMTIEVGEGGNWKFYFGGAVAAIGVVGILAATGAIR